MLISHRAFHVLFGQGVLVTDDEIRRLVEFVSAQSPPAFGTAMHEKVPISGGTVFQFLKTDSAQGLIEHTASSARSRCIAISDFFQPPLHTLTCLLH